MAHRDSNAEIRDMESMPKHEHKGHDTGGHDKMSGHGGHASHHAMMVADFRRRFWVSLVISIPIL
jgi:Cu2+-exporting ATPase